MRGVGLGLASGDPWKRRVASAGDPAGACTTGVGLTLRGEPFRTESFATMSRTSGEPGESGGGIRGAADFAIMMPGRHALPSTPASGPPISRGMEPPSLAASSLAGLQPGLDHVEGDLGLGDSKTSSSSTGSGSQASPTGPDGGRRGSSASSGSSKCGCLSGSSSTRSLTALRKISRSSAVGSGASNMSFTLMLLTARSHSSFSALVRAQKRCEPTPNTAQYEPLRVLTVELLSSATLPTSLSHHASLYIASRAPPSE
mmetsp:Transcript_51968/g.153221  ORF Transcript_51968/g.153221 Transcript_51968/m.153221 type:complete len:258 (-) Transcript_51968:358-1131(-)